MIYVQRMNLIRRMKMLPELLIRILLLSRIVFEFQRLKFEIQRLKFEIQRLKLEIQTLIVEFQRIKLEIRKKDKK